MKYFWALLHLFIIGILILLVKIVNYPYGYVCWIPIIAIMLLIDVILWNYHLRKYPLNEYEDYKFELYRYDIADVNDDGFNIDVIQSSNGIYETISGNNSLRFDLTGCLIPKSYIRAYFVRNIHYPIYNKRKCSINRFTASMRMSQNFKYQNLTITFKDDKNDKKYWLVKSGKTRVNILISEVIGTPFIWLGLNIRAGNLGKYIRVDERVYVEDKPHKKNNH